MMLASQGVVAYGIFVWYGMLVSQGTIWYIGMLVWYDMLVSYGIVGYDVSIVGYDMVYYTCMHDLEVETHVNDVKVSGMAMML